MKMAEKLQKFGAEIRTRSILKTFKKVQTPTTRIWNRDLHIPRLDAI